MAISTIIFIAIFIILYCLSIASYRAANRAEEQADRLAKDLALLSEVMSRLEKGGADVKGACDSVQKDYDRLVNSITKIKRR